MAIPVILGGAWGIGVAIVSLLPVVDHPLIRRYCNALGWATAIVLVLLLAIWAYVQIHATPGYTTDELSFDQYAAELVRQGLNPYTHSMAAAGPLVRLPPDAYSYTLNGNPVMKLSYPALSFLLYVPFMLLGWNSEVANGVNVLAFAVTIILLFALLPRRIRALGLLIATVGVYRAFAVGGVTDLLYIPLLIAAAYRWDRFGQTRASYIGPIALGLAMAIKQTPWPVLAFVVAAVAYDEFDRAGLESALKRVGLYLLTVVVAFLIPNLPYLFASPHAWVSGVFTPFTEQLVPSGQGIVMLSLFLHLGGGSLGAFTIAMALIALLTLVVFIGTYPLLRPATFVLPVIAYFFAARSQTNYLIALFPPAVVAAATCGPAVVRTGRAIAGRGVNGRRSRLALPTGWAAHWRTPNPAGSVVRSRGWAGAIVSVSALSVLALVYALASSAPLQIRITGMRTGYQAAIQELTVSVKNRSGSAVRPRFTVQSAGGDTSFWTAYHSPAELRPGQTATYHLLSPNAGADPLVTDAFSVVGYTSSPGSVSTSHRFLRKLWRTQISPQAIDSAMPVGRIFKVEVQVVDRFNNSVDRAGIDVYLTQLFDTGLRARGGTARIDNAKRGHEGIAETNRQGIATFSVVGTKASLLPVVFTAHLRDKPAKYNYGLSPALDVRFSSR